MLIKQGYHKLLLVGSCPSGNAYFYCIQISRRFELKIINKIDIILNTVVYLVI